MRGSARLVGSSSRDGQVVRRIWANSEDAWWRLSDGSWAHCLAHKGPWIAVKADEVPADVLQFLEDQKR